MRNAAKKLYLTLILILLYAPIVTLIVLSFNASKTRAKWGGFTLKWYKSLFSDAAILNALSTTISIAFLSALIATLIGTAAAIGIQAMKAKMRTLLVGVTNIPMLNADIVTGISLMLLFIACRMTLGFSTILIAHITFNIPYIILSVLPKLRQVNKSTYEAALDLGASPAFAFLRVVFPDILPGILSGFLLAFTMSLDDFIITHFTKGPGVDTLSTKIYSEVRKGIKPEMYALSTLLFITVLLLLFLINLSPKKDRVKENPAVAAGSTPPARSRRLSRILTKVVPAAIIAVMLIGGIALQLTRSEASGKRLVVYNWGEYIDPDVLTQFEEETGIQVTYEEYETNEIMYPKIQSQAIAYDVVCPSDYMIERMIQNDLLAELDWTKIPNARNIDPTYMKQSESFDPGNRYAIPYCFGTVGILYNKTMVSDPVDSWNILWDEKYRDNILMQDSVRDAFAVALKRLGFSLNSTDVTELQTAMQDLIRQKPLVQAYVVDQVRDKMIGNEAALGVIYSGEAIYCQRENANLDYIIPKEGSNVWIDSWVIPKNAENKENALQFLNFLCRADIALKNFAYITYSTPNAAARALIEDEDIKNSRIAFPSASDLKDCETYRYLGDKADNYYNELWNKVKAS